MWEHIAASMWRYVADDVQAVYAEGDRTMYTIGWIERWDRGRWTVVSDVVLWDVRDVDGLRARLMEMMQEVTR